MLKRIKQLFCLDNIGCGYLYFYIHFINEVACFYFLGNLIGNQTYLWVIALLYDILAFLPQGIIGYICDKYKKINLDFIGIGCLCIALLILGINLKMKYLSLIILCIGNAFIHVSGAERTIRCSNGKLSHSAIYVAGGSFGIIIGKILASLKIPFWIIILIVLTSIPFILLARTYKENNNFQNINCHNNKLPKYLCVILIIVVIIVRGYMGYGIPTTWNKSTLDAILLYSFMGLGKAFGGIFADRYGIKRISMISTILSLPLLIFGNNFMFLSLLGIMIFSMNMSITLYLIISILKKTPGLAFGLTTIGLFFGTLPIFFVQIKNVTINSLIIGILTIISLIILKITIREENKV